MSVELESLSPEDRAAALEEVARIHSEPAAVNTSSAGCGMFLMAFILFVAAPFVVRHALWLRIPFYVLEGALVLLGVYWYFRGSGGAYSKAAMSAEQAIETMRITWPPEAKSECARAAARLLAVAYYSDGPSTATTFNFEAARQQLGPALPFVVSVEQFLIAEGKASPVFTLSTTAGEPPSPS